MNIANFISRYGSYYGDKIAVVFGDKRLSFSEMSGRINRLANVLLHLGVKSDDKVALLANNCPQFIEVFFARYELGVTEVTLNTKLSPYEWVRQLNDAEVNTLFVGEDLAEKVSSIRSRLQRVKHLIALSGTPRDMMDYETLILQSNPNPPRVEVDVGQNKLQRILYTGGTTGVPKGIMLSRAADLAQLRNVLVDLVPDLNSNDVFLGLQPFYHAVRPFFFPCWMRGTRQIIVSDFHPEAAINAIENEKVSVIKTVPTVLVRLISDPGVRGRRLGSVRTLIYGGSPMPVEKLKEGIGIFGPVFVQNYGQSESAMTVCCLSKSDHVIQGEPKKVARLSSVGHPYSWVEVKLVDENGEEVAPGELGELIVRGDHNMMGYLNNPEETRKTLKDGWVHTRDIGRIDEEGYVFLVDRKGDMIISGGENVYPGEVEQVLYEHPAVMEACVFGIPDEKWGESVTAAVAPKPGMSMTEEELIGYCKQRLARYKSPQKILFFGSLPKSSMGKILRRELRAPYWKGRNRAIH
jgi:acyl-CoA synthetase (AMP-forming)/AMP-acid ligase II